MANYFVKYYDGVLKNWKGYEEFQTATGPYRVVFEKTPNGYIAKDVPENIAVKLHRSDAYDIVDEKGVIPAEFATGASPRGVSRPSLTPPPPPEQSTAPAPPPEQSTAPAPPIINEPETVPAPPPAKSTAKKSSR